VPTFGDRAFATVGQHWADVIQRHLEEAILIPAESLLASVPVAASLTSGVAMPQVVVPDGRLVPERMPAPHGPELTPPIPAAARGAEAELTIEVVSASRDGPVP
jgi:hypothetical protein